MLFVSYCEEDVEETKSLIFFLLKHERKLETLESCVREEERERKRNKEKRKFEREREKMLLKMF